ncbi:MAG: flagellar basal body L-ring protein FlgH [Phycisphaerae bacterium]
MKKNLLILTMIAGGTAWQAPALGQAAPTAAAPTPPVTQADRDARRIAAAAAAAEQAPPSTGEMLRLSGGSLLQAGLLARDPNVATINDVSFFAVPEPEPLVLQKHDLVTIIVREASSHRSDGSTELEKSYEASAIIREFIKPGFPLEAAITDYQPAIDGQAERSFEGEGAVDRRDEITARITAEVLDVKPNGNVVLQARKRINIDDDEQIFLLSGTVRVKDINADNTVLSSQLYDLNLEKKTSGPVRDATKRGFVPRMVDKLNPF